MEAIIALLVVLGTLTACAGETVLDVKNALPMAGSAPGHHLHRRDEDPRRYDPG